jgi:hypothetical protein
MKKQGLNQTNRIQEDDALTELASILPAADRLRVAALGQMSSFTAAKQKSLLRQEKMIVARHGSRLGSSQSDPSPPGNGKAPERRDVGRDATNTDRDCIAQSGSADDARPRGSPQRLAMAGLTVSAIDSAGRAVVSACSNDNGYFALAVPAAGRDQRGKKSCCSSAMTEREFCIAARSASRGNPAKCFIGSSSSARRIRRSNPRPPPEVDPKAITVPDVGGLAESTARAQIRAVGLSVESTTKEGNNEEVGRVIEQKPKAGTKVAPCSVVTIVVGAQAKVQVPNVVGQTLREAQAALKKSELSAGKIEPDGASPESHVIRQSPAAGAEVALETAVDLVAEEPTQQVHGAKRRENERHRRAPDHHESRINRRNNQAPEGFGGQRRYRAITERRRQNRYRLAREPRGSGTVSKGRRAQRGEAEFVGCENLVEEREAQGWYNHSPGRA